MLSRMVEFTAPFNHSLQVPIAVTSTFKFWISKNKHCIWAGQDGSAL